METIIEIPRADIIPDLDQPRKTFDPDKLAELRASMNGGAPDQPITVRPVGKNKYTIITGEMRFRASTVDSLKCIVREGLDSQTIRDMQLRENLYREDLNAPEQGAAFVKYREEFGKTQEELADRIGKSQTYVSKMESIHTSLHLKCKDMIIENKLGIEEGRMISTIPDGSKQVEVAEAAIERNLSQAEVREAVKRVKAKLLRAVDDIIQEVISEAKVNAEARIEAANKAKKEAEESARVAAGALKKLEAKVKAEKEAEAEAKGAAEAKVKAEKEAEVKAEGEAKAKAEAEAKEEEEAKAKAEEKAKVWKAGEEARAKEEKAAKVLADAAAKGELKKEIKDELTSEILEEIKKAALPRLERENADIEEAAKVILDLKRRTETVEIIKANDFRPSLAIRITAAVEAEPNQPVLVIVNRVAHEGKQPEEFVDFGRPSTPFATGKKVFNLTTSLYRELSVYINPPRAISSILDPQLRSLYSLIDIKLREFNHPGTDAEAGSPKIIEAQVIERSE